LGDLKFVPQSKLDSWADLGKITLTGSTLCILDEDLSLTLTPAVRFLSLLEGQDSNGLIGKVKAETYVRDIGGEVVTDSCLVGDTAYQVEPGFLAEPEGAGGKGGGVDSRKGGAAPGKAGSSGKTAALTRFLLESLE